MEEFLAEDKQNMEQVTSIVSDESKQRDLVLEDEEEDFLDDGNISALEILENQFSSWIGCNVRFNNFQRA